MYRLYDLFVLRPPLFSILSSSQNLMQKRIKYAGTHQKSEIAPPQLGFAFLCRIDGTVANKGV